MTKTLADGYTYATPDTITPQQATALCRILRDYNEDFNGLGGHEIKEYEVHRSEYGTLSVIVEEGLIGDEGTMAQIFCRNRIHVFIGIRGGITFYPWKSRSYKGRPYRGAFATAYDQKYHG